MTRTRLRITAILLVSLIFELPVPYGHGETPHAVTYQELSDAIAELGSGKHEVEPIASKDDAGAHLAHLIRRAKPDQIDDKTIADIGSLLDSSNDYIRFWAATSLGELGPRARIAIPKLLKLLPVVDCLNGTITSASAVRLALMRIGGLRPPVPSCKDRVAGE
jgi:hypothetical protein